MDDRKHSISPHDLYAQLGSEAAPIIVDVRRDADFVGRIGVAKTSAMTLSVPTRSWLMRFIALQMTWEPGEPICQADGKSSPTAFMDNR